jgi:hypothetical protein
MERRSFYFLYVNLNSLGEIALRQLAADALAHPPEISAPENLSQDELDARVLAGFENLDLSALDGLDLSSSPPDSVGFEASTPEEISASDGELDVEQYLARAYTYEEQLRSRIDAHYRRADLGVMDTLLTQLPPHLHSLTTPLTAVDMEEWLTLYKNGNEVLTDLVLTMRQLDLSS